MGLCLGLLLPVQGFAASTTLNFKGADINAVIQSVADITGKNFIVDPRVKGKVTIISKRPMSQREIYQVFLTVLDVHGYTAVPSGKITKIIPDADAKHSGMPTADDDDPGIGDQSVTRVIQIDHVNAAQLVPILRPLVPPQGHLAAYPQSNVLIVSDRARNIERILKIIKRVDQPTSGEIEIIQVENASAADLVRVLNTLEQQSGKGQAQTEKPILVADERTNSILVGGERSERLQIRAIISHLDTPSEVQGDTHVLYLRFANAKDLVPVLTGVAEEAKKTIQTPGAKGAPQAAGQRGQPIFNIQADESSNALVITAPPALFKSLESVIRQLDVRRAQVLVEAIIAEVSLDRSSQLGIEWFFDGRNSDKPVGAINFSGAGAAAANITSTVSDNASSTEVATGLASLIGKGATIAFGKFNSDSFNFAAVLKALEGDGDTNILSTPSIVTLDNEEAEIFVGEEVSIPTGSFTSTGTSTQPTNPFTTFDRKPVGINLKVKPQINEGDTILLNIEQSIDAFKSGSAGSQDIVTSQRKINTSVLVDNGKILVLGGLVQDNLIQNDQSVPFFGDIPIIGALFRSSSTQKVKTNLMVFLRPLVMRDSRQGLLLTNSKYNYLRELQMQSRSEESYLLPDEPAPLLPEFDSQLELPPAYTNLPDKDQGLFQDSDLEPMRPQEIE
ncbi:MAG: type II secretion system secretin GspD [Gammaproteobacteria bacterium]|nr:type II secretion system secretin GspD [Gammaproteobacteria bacterium]